MLQSSQSAEWKHTTQLVELYKCDTMKWNPFISVTNLDFTSNKLSTIITYPVNIVVLPLS